MGHRFRTAACVLAIAAVGVSAASAKRNNVRCADASEVSALQTAAVQQELMDAALGCGPQAMQDFNTFQTSFSMELRRSDKTLLTMFKRVYGGSRGDAEYNLFKTNMASKAEIRRVRGMANFCTDANLVLAAALAPQKPTLRDFVAGVQIADTNESPVGSCEISVALTLQGALAAPNIIPTPNPLRIAMLFPPDSPPAPATFPDAAPAQLMPPQQPAAPPPAAPAEQPKPKKSGFLSGLFH